MLVLLIPSENFARRGKKSFEIVKKLRRRQDTRAGRNSNEIPARTDGVHVRGLTPSEARRLEKADLEVESILSLHGCHGSAF
jgi:hypothetical protein